MIADYSSNIWGATIFASQLSAFKACGAPLCQELAGWHFDALMGNTVTIGYLEGCPGSDNEFVSAFDRAWYEKAARQDNKWAYHMLAFMNADGNGAPKDAKRAEQYFEISLPKTNDPWAKWKLALVEKSDPKRSRTLLVEAAEQGNQQARDELRKKLFN